MAAAAAPRNNASFVVHYSTLLLVAALYLSSSSSSFHAAAQQTVVPNVTQVLTEAGNFTTFLAVAGAANVTQALQSFIGANNTAGATAFIPVDLAFTSEVVAAYGNLSAANQSLVLYYHVVPRFYNATEVLTLSNVATLASGNSSSAFRLRAVNRSSSSGVITIYGNLNSANVTNKTVNVTAFPIAIHPIDTVLLPKEIFGTPAANSSSNSTNNNGAAKHMSHGTTLFVSLSAFLLSFHLIFLA